MPIKELAQKIKDKQTFKDPFEGIVDDLRTNKSAYYKFPLLSNADTLTFVIKRLQAKLANYKLDFILYQQDIDGTLRRHSQTTIVPFSPQQWYRDISPASAHYLEIFTNSDVHISFEVIPKGYKIIKTFQPVAQTGNTLTVDLQTFPRRPDRQCDIPLRYKLLEGELPLGLRMTETGFIEGKPCNLDDYIKVNAPSFNWFYQNHDGVQVSFGIVFRIKVQVRMLLPEGLSDKFDERWFCIRILNNWSFDKPVINPVKRVIEHEICEGEEQFQPPLPSSLCPTCEEETVLNELPDFVKLELTEFCPDLPKPEDPNLYRKEELRNEIPSIQFCTACQDPTKDTLREFVEIDTYFVSPEDLMKYYFYYDKHPIEQQPNQTMARLYASPFFQELVTYIQNPNPQNATSIVELRLHDGVRLELIKFKDLEERELFNIPAEWEAIRNTRNQEMEIEVNCYYGDEVYAEYRTQGQ
mgnify:CR=1 FL=1|jgi:hypothetical protein|nr:MAG TPA: hypothetical protein [Caudoviricetes sp.]